MTYEEIKVAEINQSVGDRPDGKEIYAKIQRNFLDHQLRVDAIDGIVASVTADHFTGMGPSGDTLQILDGTKWNLSSAGSGTRVGSFLAGEHVFQCEIGNAAFLRPYTKRLFRPKDLPTWESRQRIDNWSNVEHLYVGFFRQAVPAINFANDALCYRKRKDILPEFFGIDDAPSTPFALGQVSAGIAQPQNNEWFTVRIEWKTSTVVECYFNDVLIHTFSAELGDTIPDADAEIPGGWWIDMPAGFGGTLKLQIDWMAARNTKLLDAA